MGNVGIIAEYNPFHNGHAYHLEMAKAASGGRAIVVMSGDFVQRGEPAAFDKFDRTRWALENGADMVLALPAVFSLANAECFAIGGVSLLAGTGLVDCIAFGSECGDVEKLKAAAALIDSETDNVKGAIKRTLSEGCSYPQALSRAYGEAGSAVADIFSSPNDILGVEYIRALNRFAPHIRLIAIQRQGAAHDDAKAENGFMSAAALRDMLCEDIAQFVPKDVYNDIHARLSANTIPRHIDALSQAALYAIRLLSVQEIARICDVSEGLENVIYRAARDCSTLDEFLSAVKTRRYTMARIKRIAMRALLGIAVDPKGMLPGLYIRVLGVRKDSRDLLSGLSQSASLPVISRFSDVEALSPAQRALHDVDMTAAAVAPLAAPSPLAARFDYAEPLITV